MVDCDYDTSSHGEQYGGAGHSDSDHALENDFDVTGMLKKKFGLDTKSLFHSWPRWLAEFAKILRTCAAHHQHDSSADSCFSDLPSSSSKEYFLTDENGAKISDSPPVAPCVVHESPQGKAVLNLTEHYCGMTRLQDVSFQEISGKYDNESPFAFVDIHDRRKRNGIKAQQVNERKHSDGQRLQQQRNSVVAVFSVAKTA